MQSAPQEWEALVIWEKGRAPLAGAGGGEETSVDQTESSSRKILVAKTESKVTDSIRAAERHRAENRGLGSSVL